MTLAYLNLISHGWTRISTNYNESRDKYNKINTFVKIRDNSWPFKDI